MRTKLSQFNVDLPKDLIAQYPVKSRDESRLMVVHRDSGKIEHKIFRDIIEYFDDGDCFVFNNTKVFPARMFGRKEKTGAINCPGSLSYFRIERPAYSAVSPSASSMRISWLYLANRSERASEPVLI